MVCNGFQNYFWLWSSLQKPHKTKVRMENLELCVPRFFFRLFPKSQNSRRCCWKVTVKVERSFESSYYFIFVTLSKLLARTTIATMVVRQCPISAYYYMELERFVIIISNSNHKDRL